MSAERTGGKSIYRTVRDYAIIAIAMIMGVIGLNLFLVPNEITMGGTMGVAEIVYWGTGIQTQYTYFAINAALLIAALKVLGWRFCVKTVYAVVVFTVASSVFQWLGFANVHLLADQKFMACIVGGVFMGTSVGLGLSAGGSTGGSDVVAAMIHKYRDVSLGHIILFCDLTIITSSYVVLHDWEKVLYGYVLLFIVSFCVDYVVNSLRRSVQFLIISRKWEEIGLAINKIADRGCSTLNGNGFYSKRDIKVIFCIAKKSESAMIFDIVDEIDPDAFVAQSAVIGVYGQGFDRVRVRKKISLEEIKKEIKA
ncbi:MAG: YitT family protein [Prevotella sp.]|nr:YitT family protein [Prevotella sp.]MDD7189811.1 YitT family protein [Prevotella sp.]MDY5314168.1 YitT family protein [Prevotella sp.]